MKRYTMTQTQQKVQARSLIQLKLKEHHKPATFPIPGFCVTAAPSQACKAEATKAPAQLAQVFFFAYREPFQFNIKLR